MLPFSFTRKLGFIAFLSLSFMLLLVSSICAHPALAPDIPDTSVRQKLEQAYYLIEYAAPAPVKVPLAQVATYIENSLYATHNCSYSKAYASQWYHNFYNYHTDYAKGLREILASSDSLYSDKTKDYAHLIKSEFKKYQVFAEVNRYFSYI
jgi:hypothetical protein